MRGELQGISSEYVFAASCAQAFKRRKVKANKLKSESINSRAIGKLRSVAKWAQTFVAALSYLHARRVAGATLL